MLSSTLVLGVFASAAVAVNTARSLQFPDTVSLSERQSEGPRYECHANCGYALQGATGDYCEDEEWLGLFQGCLECALEFDIWRHYGGGLTPAARACGLDATPVPVDGDDEETTTAAETTAAETTAVETTAVEATTVVETTAVEATTVAETTDVEATTVVETTAVEATTPIETVSTETTIVEVSTSTSYSSSWTTTPLPTVPGNATETGEPSSVPTAGASKNWGSVVVAGAAVVLAVNLI